MKRIPINTTNTGEAFGLKFSYFKNVSLTTLTGGVDTSLVLGSWR